MPYFRLKISSLSLVNLKKINSWLLYLLCIGCQVLSVYLFVLLFFGFLCSFWIQSFENVNSSWCQFCKNLFIIVPYMMQFKLNYLLHDVYSIAGRQNTFWTVWPDWLKFCHLGFFLLNQFSQKQAASTHYLFEGFKSSSMWVFGIFIKLSCRYFCIWDYFCQKLGIILFWFLVTLLLNNV